MKNASIHLEQKAEEQERKEAEKRVKEEKEEKGGGCDFLFSLITFEG